MDRQAGLTPAPQGLALLATLRGRQLRRIALDLGRAPVFAVGLVGLWFGFRRAFALEPESNVARLVCETVAANMVFSALLRLVGHLEGDALFEGPLHLLLAGKGRLTVWRQCVAGLSFSVLAVLALSALASLEIARVPAFAAAVLLGAGLALVADRRTRAAPSATNQGVISDRRPQRSVSGRWLIARVQWRGGPGQTPLWPLALLVALLGGAATALGVRNNPDPAVGSALLAMTGLGAGTILSAIDLSLLRFTATQPVRLGFLCAQFIALPPALAGFATAGIGIAAGVPAGTSLLIAVGVGFVLLTYSGAVLLHALGGARRFPTTAAALDLAIAAVLGAAFVPLAAAWVLLRAVMLTAQARRRRWLEV